jgi:MerR family transcriptional regulator, copper efflux regulator
VERFTVGRAAEQTGWSPRMLRYIERLGLVVPTRTSSGYRQYDRASLERLRSLRGLLGAFDIEIGDVVFAARVRREPALRTAVDSWLAGVDLEALEWDQRKHERLLAA